MSAVDEKHCKTAIDASRPRTFSTTAQSPLAYLTHVGALSGGVHAGGLVVFYVSVLTANAAIAASHGGFLEELFQERHLGCGALSVYCKITGRGQFPRATLVLRKAISLLHQATVRSVSNLAKNVKKCNLVAKYVHLTNLFDWKEKNTYFMLFI